MRPTTLVRNIYLTLTLTLILPSSGLLAEPESLFLSCKTTAMTLCVGDKVVESCPKPWIPVSDSPHNHFSISKMSDTWTLATGFTVELTLVESDEQYFEFTFDSDADWARLRIDRLTGEAIELHGVPQREILAAKSTCEKAERKF